MGASFSPHFPASLDADARLRLGRSCPLSGFNPWKLSLVLLLVNLQDFLHGGANWSLHRKRHLHALLGSSGQCEHLILRQWQCDPQLPGRQHYSVHGWQWQNDAQRQQHLRLGLPRQLNSTSLSYARSQSRLAQQNLRLWRMQFKGNSSFWWMQWRSMASAFVEQKHHQLAASRNAKIRMLLAKLKLCKNIERGKELHSEARKDGIDSCVYVASALVNMYAKCGRMVEARQVFEHIKRPDMVSWNALILGYADNGLGETALDLFARMKRQGCSPDSYTFVAALKGCASLAAEQDECGRAESLEHGKRIHSEIGCHRNNYVLNTLIDMYAKCGCMVGARQAFDSMEQPDLTSWNALILGYAKNGQAVRALDMFNLMKFRGFQPDPVSFIGVLKACTSLGLEQDGKGGRQELLEQGKQIHAQINCLPDANLQNTLIDMYANLGSMADAHQVFDAMKHPNVISWNSLILGYAENGEGVTSLDLFARMKVQGHAPDSVTFIAALKACSLLGALTSGHKIRAEMNTAIEGNAALLTSLVDFYAKCGNLVEAHKIFQSHPGTRNVKTWNALLTGYSRLGDIKAVIGLFEGMLDAGLQPTRVTFLCILICCSHAGLLEKATEYFEAMSTKYGVPSGAEHCGCMVDILGRSNKLDDAMALLRSMPYRPSCVTWTTVLAACRKWKNVAIGRLAFKSLVSLDDKHAPAYVVMAHIYGSRGMWEEQDMVLGMRAKYEAFKCC